MKSKERKVLEGIEIIFIGILIGFIIGIIFETFQLFIGEQTKFVNLILWLLGFGLTIVILALIGLAKEKLRDYEIIYGSKATQAMRERFKEDKEKFLQQFKDAKAELKHDPKQDPNVYGEPEIIIDAVEKDPFAGDPVYDNLDNLFGYTKRVVDGEQGQASRNFVDAEFTVVGSTVPAVEDDLASFTVAELKDLCKVHGITGYSAMRKAELIEVLENYNRAQR